MQPNAQVHLLVTIGPMNLSATAKAAAPAATVPHFFQSKGGEYGMGTGVNLDICSARGAASNPSEKSYFIGLGLAALRGPSVGGKMKTTGAVAIESLWKMAGEPSKSSVAKKCWSFSAVGTFVQAFATWFHDGSNSLLGCESQPMKASNIRTDKACIHAWDSAR